MRSIDTQIGAIRRDWPDFRLTRRSGGRLTWKGPIRPFGMEYTIQISLAMPREYGYRKRLGGVPRTTVLTPKLIRRSSVPDAPFPHVYENEDDPEFPLLCLYDPGEREWSHQQLIAETIVPWTIEWLACYEIWHATGDWVGGGRHPSLT